MDQQKAIQNQGFIISEMQRDLKKNNNAIFELRKTINKQYIHIKQQAMIISTLNERYKVLMEITPSNTETKLDEQRFVTGKNESHLKGDEPFRNEKQIFRKRNTEPGQEQDSAFLDEKRRVVTGEGPIAFTATLSHTLDTLGPHQNIVFDHVILNIGGGYHNQHGIFIAPRSGIYLFASSLLSNYWVQADLVKNGEIVGTIYNYAHSDQSSDQGSVTVIIQVNQGDEVWITNVFNGGVVRGGYFTTFCGYLLMPM